MSTDRDDPVFKALADRTRRELLDRLRRRPHTTGELCDRFDSSRFAVMKHLKVLVDAGLVLVERRGRERLNTLNPVPLRRIQRRWLRRFDVAAADRMLDLEQHLASPPQTNRSRDRA
ncbi:MAG: helix-turn-helix transcriptional regulator [Planctomycetes bacterium]|nr:helix-turn-helix transcriptional regulator [Planctomycetota bacterium]